MDKWGEEMSRQRKRRRRGRGKNWFLQLSKGKKIAVCIGGAVLCLLAVGIITLAVKLGKINSEEINTDDIIMSEEAGASGEGYTNIALFGIDSRTGELEKGTRTDCLIVASLNNETKEVKMVSVYRDTVLDIEDNYLQKCNAAYAFGGPTQAINMLNKNLDLNIQDYATVDFAAIANAIDMLGGLEIEIKPEEIKPLNKFVKETARVAGKEAHTVSEPGLQLLDGVQATTYARIRSTAGGDFTRTERQRLVIEKIVEKAQQTDIATINKMIDELFPTIKTSFSAAEILSYAKDFMKYDIAGSEGFPFEKTTATISGLGSIVIPVTLADNVTKLHEFLYGEENYVPSATVQTIHDAIIARVGQRDATDYSTLSNQTYVDTAEDKAQEHNQYQPKPESTPEDTGSTTKPENDSKEDADDKPAQNNKPSNDNSSGDSGNNKPEQENNKPKPEEEKPTVTPPEEDAGTNTPPETEDNGGGESAPDTGNDEGTSGDAGNDSGDDAGNDNTDAGSAETAE